MKVKYHHEQPKLCHGNIIWAKRDRGTAYCPVSKYAPVRGGRFPQDHPAAPNAEARANDRAEFATSPALEAFRARGYWASCFPEGDGITMSCERGQPSETVVNDIAECFGWEVEVVG